MNAITWTDETDRRLRPYASANRWAVTLDAKTYKVERMPAAYHVWDGLDWLGMYVDQEDVEAAITAHAPAEEAEVEAEGATDADVLAAFEAKANEVAKANQWTIARAETVMLAYLRDHSPAEAATIAAALLGRMGRAA
ncbi:hypothetical protein OIU81_03130 [Streptomyces sp. NBC_01454]|uniref:hypothetical protein n=1 Tax=Streptomyces sp. NBC_01454 TaxID=2975867 RepID=UPI002E31BA35|nr:hypothetical protein [Streptomyces sp. NBC_01454]